MRCGLLTTVVLFCLLMAEAALAQPTCTLQVSPASGTAPLSVTASGLCTSPEQNITEVILAWGDGAQVFVSPGFTVSHTYNSSGTFNAVLTAFDANGFSGSATEPVKVSPALQCAPSATPATGTVPLAVKVAANCTDAHSITSTVVQLGDGYYQSGATGNHTYVSAGSYRVVITARDNAGNAFVGTTAVNATAAPFLFVSINNGQVKEFGKDGSPKATLDTNANGSTTGMAFDAKGNLYVADFTANAVSRFTGTALTGTFGAGYNCKPESIVFDHAGNAYVGETGCSHAIVKLDAYGTITAAYQPATEQQGTDWIDLAADQCTIYYTSQGPSVLRFNACTRQQLPPLTSQLKEGVALRILPDDGVVVANLQNIMRFDGSGKPVKTYDAPGEDCWSALALDSDGTSFWATDYCTSDVVRFDLNSGAQISKFNAGVPANSVFGIQTFAPPHTTAAGTFVASAGSATVTPGQAASYSLTLTPVGAAVGQDFSFSCSNLPVGASCTFSPATATVQAGGLTTNLTVNTSTGTAAQLKTREYPGFWFALLLPFFSLLTMAGGQESRRRWLLLVVLLLAVGFVSCGGSGASSPTTSPTSNTSAPPTPSNGSTPVGGYTVVVHAQSGSQESSTTVQLAVQ